MAVIFALVAGMLGDSATATPLRASADPALGDRGVAVELLKTGGRATRTAAEAALLGSEEQLREFVATGQYVTIGHDNRIKVGQLMAVGGRRVREAAQVALGGGPDDVRRFLEGGWKEPQRLDLRAKVGTIMAANGASTQRAGQAALEGTADDVLRFLAAGRLSPEIADRRKQVGAIIATGGPEVNKAGQIALNGDDNDVQEFLETGQHTARARDNEKASIDELVNLVKLAGQAAARETELAKEASARAVAAAELAKQAALTAADEAAAAKGDAQKAAAAAGRAADFASRAAQAAQEAISAANSANKAAGVASAAASRAASAASSAAQAASEARGAAAAAATDAGKAGAARDAAAKAKKVAIGARLAADASKAAGDAANQAASAAQSAASAGSNADRAASAAENAANQAGVSESEAARARRAAADAHKFAGQANRAAARAESLARMSAQAAMDAYTAAMSAAGHADEAAAEAIKAADHAGDALKARDESLRHAKAAQLEATTATQTAELADRIEKNAREADKNRLQQLQEEGVAAAEKVKAELEHKAAWDAAEATRIDQETQLLLEKAAAPDADTATLLANGRQAALRLRTTGGPWTQAAAELVLAGGEVEMLDYLQTGRIEAAEEDDRARVRYVADNTTVDKQREAAQDAYLGDGVELREFLKTQYYEGKVVDDRKKVGQIMAKGGPATQRAGQKALEGTPADVDQFLAVGQYDAAEQDDRIKIGQLISTGGPEVQAAAQIALAGPPAYAREFVQSGQFKAAQRDQLTASHVAGVRRLVADASRIAATARANAEEAFRVAADAADAADEARMWAEKARQSANEAATYAQQAKQSAADAQASADRAAESAKTARSAADAAERDAEAASLSATRATTSASQAKASASDAARSAQAARASEAAAGRDAAMAYDEAAAAHDIALAKYQAEQRAIATGPLTAQEGSDLARTCNNDQACIDKYNKAVADANVSLVDFLKTEGAEIILDMIGYTDAVNCFTQGDVEACLMTALNALTFGNPVGLFTKGGKLVAAIVKVAGKVGAFLRRVEQAKTEVKATREAISEAMKACKLPVIGMSFAPTVQVLLADGTHKAIKDVVAGDRVAAADPQTGRVGFRAVTALIVGSDLKQMVSITVGDGAGAGSVDATGNHPFWVVEQQKWLEAKDITAGVHLLTPDGKPAKVVDVRSYTQVMQVYNLTVEDLHTYYVLAGDIPVLVHNAAKRTKDADYYNRPGKKYSTYVLRDSTGKVYYVGLFGSKQTKRDVERRHSKSGPAGAKRFQLDADDIMEVLDEDLPYYQARLDEQANAEKYGTYSKDGNPNDWRRNRQNPLAADNRVGYEAHAKREAQLAGKAC
ncbi:polymorphic toxin-type HINT domain-containing protein [Amycolatopsis sp. cg5]|uniref:polymorphic toxin-type HINT domain-containing protein n=1 Tax=Amycolatopsis sp. cg5 TaxID=3238802 RepID=UPI003525BAB0